MTVLGGATGAAILLLTPARTFQLVVPVLIAGRVPCCSRSSRGSGACRRGPKANASIALNVALFGAAVYVGYFGAGGGVLLLAVLGVMVDEALARVNAIKNVVSGLANFVAAATSPSSRRCGGHSWSRWPRAS